MESFALRNSVVFRQAEAGKAGEAPVNWWIVGGVAVGAALWIRHDNKKDNQIATTSTSTSTTTTTTATPPACFTARTRVVMADGSFKPISEIAIGDEVQSWNFETGRIAANSVSRLHRFDADGILRINGLEVTGKHPFAVGDNVWAEAGDLRTSDLLVGRDSRKRVEIAQLARTGKTTPVFDLTVANDHNFLVDDGSETILVHNKAGVGCFLRGTEITMSDGTQRSIEEIAAGECVRSFNLDAGEWVDAEVSEAQAFRQASTGYYVMNERLRVSPVHQLAVNGSWKAAPELRLGDWLTDIGTARVPVTSVRYVEEKADRYNLVLGRNPRLLYAVEGLMVWNGW